MPLLALLVIACQVVCGLHVVRSGQERYWLYLIIALPGLGCLIYGLGVMLPNLLGSRSGRRAVARVQDKLDPERYLRDLRDELSLGDTSHSHALLADELLRLGQAEEAASHYQAALRGVHAQAPELLLSLARAQFAQGDARGCRLTLERLIEHNPQFRSPAGHVLYAQALAQDGETEKAETEYLALLDYFAGPEARYHYALLLKRLGRLEPARQQLESIQAYARRAPKHYRNLHREWLALTRQALQALEPSTRTESS
ncbi:MAG: tetratricopeptide repeat protein [Pseudomonadota bacterium]